jgi:hypothetical protein
MYTGKDKTGNISHFHRYDSHLAHHTTRPGHEIIMKKNYFWAELHKSALFSSDAQES